MRSFLPLPFLLAMISGACLPSLGRAEEATTFPGTPSTWNGFAQYDFEIHGKPVLVVTPKSVAAGRPWVWHGEFFGHKPAPDIALLKEGFHVVYLKVPDMLGSPKAVAHWNDCYAEMTAKYGLAPKQGFRLVRVAEPGEEAKGIPREAA